MSAREELFRRVAGAFVSEDRANKLIDDVIAEALPELSALRARVAEVEDYERLSPQQCPKGLHADWLVDSEYAHACPWCRIDDLAAAHSNATNQIAGLECDLSAAKARVAELEALKPAAIQTCQTCNAGYTYGEDCANCVFQARMAAAALPRQQEDPHDSVLHHDYALGRDLPVIPRQTTGRCPDCRGTFEDCTCGGAS